MDLPPIIDYQEQEYIICDRTLVVVHFSADAAKYADQELIIGEDLRIGFPEIVGLESTCQAILSGQQQNFGLATVARSVELEQTLYFDLLIKAQDKYLIILLSDVTEQTLTQQLSVQRINEAEINLNKLQRFEYCTNKIIASMQDVLLITSPQGKIERVNKSCIEIFKQEKFKLLNKSIDNLIQDPSFNHQDIYNYLIFSQDKVRKIEVNFINEQKQRIQIEFDCFIAPTEVKNYFNCVYIGRDMTARRQAEDEIRIALAREKELKELKSGFISMASHEFRNPLSSILLCVQNLQNDSHGGDENRDFYLQSIQNAALTMNSLLEDILVLNKAELEQQQLKLESINLPEFCQNIIQSLTAIYKDRQIEFDYQGNSSLFNLDRTTLSNILNNLLSNALKYSALGTTVNLNIIQADEPDSLRIEICDRGIGIPPEAQKHLFESFFRASNVNSTPGTGLGLSIVKKSVDLYQGSITVNSKVNQGTKIIVLLPIP
ncbi:MAG: PAS domain-containing sensor histidine kinase [Cyanobacteria bacterium J06621_8]